LLAAAPAHAKTKPPSSSGATVEKVLDFYHTTEFRDDCLHHVEEAVDRRRKEVQMDDDLAKRIKDVAARIYVKKNLYDVFKVAYAKQTTLENMTALWDWMNSPRGISLKKAYDQHYGGKGNYKEWKAYYDKEAGIVLKPNRKNAINTYITANEQADYEINKILGGDFAVWWTANQMSAQKEPIKYIKSKIKPRRTGYLEAAREYFGIYDFSLLRDLRNEEIDDISRFASTVVGQGASKAYANALEQTMDSAAKTLANEIAKGTK
jgi:hypothetical protein